jgi:NADH dehydrogenase
MDFGNPVTLVQTLTDVDTLYNSYYIRYPHRTATFESTVNNTRVLIASAVEAGVKRIVHVSVIGADRNNHLAYFRGKDEQERIVTDSGISYATLRPTWIFGIGDVLTTDIAWMLRRFPIFAIPGDGKYRLQPVAATDFAGIAIEAGGRTDDLVWDAAGPDVFTFGEMIDLIRRAVGSRGLSVRLPRWAALKMSQMIGLVLRDKLMTPEEIRGLSESILVSDESPRGTTSFKDWLDSVGERLGTAYVSETGRHFR